MTAADPPQPTEEQLRALQAQLEQVTVSHVLVQAMVDLLNVGAHKARLTTPPGEPGPPPDWSQTGLAIEAVRALLPVVEPHEPQAATAVRDMLSQLQMAFARAVGAAAGPVAGAAATPAGAPGAAPAGGTAPVAPGPGEAPQGPGPAQQSGRLWVPGR